MVSMFMNYYSSEFKMKDHDKIKKRHYEKYSDCPKGQFWPHALKLFGKGSWIKLPLFKWLHDVEASM